MLSMLKFSARMLPVLLLAVIMCGESVALGNQKSHLCEEKKLTDGVKARVCLEHDLKVTCGWEMEMSFSSRLSRIEVWKGTIRSMLTGPNGGTIVTLNSRLSTDNFVSGNCVHFIAFFEGLETPEVAAELTRVCQDGQFTDVSKEDQNIKEGTDYYVDLDVSCSTSIQGQICLFHTTNITCGFDAEIIFSTSVTALTVNNMTVIGVEEMSPGSRYQLVNRMRQGAQPDNPTCHKFEVRHKENSKPLIKGRYTRACDEGRFTTKPNKAIPGLSRNKVVSCYFESWAQVKKGLGHFQADKIEPDLCTDIIYPYTEHNPRNFRLMKFYLDLYKSIVALKQRNPSLKIHLAVTVATYGVRFSNSFTSSSFNINNTAAFLRTHGFDGLVLHWEDRRKVHKQMFTQACEILFTQFQKEALVSKMPRLLLSADVSADREYREEYYEPAIIHNYLDHINVMSLDIYRSWPRGLGHYNPLYVRVKDRNSSASVMSKNASLHWWQAMGVPANKLLMSLDTYGLTFKIPSNDSQATLPGAPWSRLGERGEYCYEPGRLAYYEICELFSEGNWTVDWMPDSLGPYAYGVRDNNHWEWIAYEDVESMTEKAQYIVDNGLGGVIFEDMASDYLAHNVCKQGSYPLINAVRNVFKQL